MPFKYFIFLLALPAVVMAQQPESPLVQSYAQHLKHKQESPYGLEWTHLGPTSNSALVETFQVDSQHPGTLYVGFGSGNLWKTSNNGLSWKPIFENQPSYGIGDVALAPSNTNIIYLGTGETLKKPRNFTMPGTGVYRSDNGGETWTHLGLSDSWHIGKVTVHPTNPDIVYVSVLGHFWSPNANRGVYRSLDGGKNWEHVLYVNDRTGSNDVVMAPSNPQVLYASMWENYPGVSGNSSGIYKSTDAGKTWMKSDEGLPVSSGRGRIGLAVSYQNPDKVYALMDHRDKPAKGEEQPGAAELYRTEDGGKTWQRTHTDEFVIFSVIGWYFADVVVNPDNDNEVYALGVRLAHSLDGGKTFDLVGGDVYHLFPNPAEPLHLDQCELWINPANTNHLILGNDGGLYISYDKGKTWMHFNNIPTGEFYDITLDNKQPYTIYGGTQDDATVYGQAREWNPKRYDGWKYLWIDPWSGGDGCITVVDPMDSTVIYYSSQEGGIRKLDTRTGQSLDARPDEEKLKLDLAYNFISPYFLSSFNHNHLYLGGNYLLKSENQGKDWKAISPNLAVNKDKSRNSLAAGALAESPLQKGLLYFGTDKGLFWMTPDDGKTWNDYSKGLPNRYVRSITPSKYKESRVYVALSGINYDDFNTYLYVSEDYGKTWTSIKNNLPSEVAYVIKEDPRHENILYAGLYRAVYVSVDKGNNWFQLGRGMPAAAVSDIEIDNHSNDLVVSTHGRGIYKTNLKPLYELQERSGNTDPLWLDSPANVNVPSAATKRVDSNAIELEKMPIWFWTKEAGEVTLQVMDQAGHVVWMDKVDTRKGLNQYNWDLVVKRSESPLPYFIGYTEYLPIGRYTLKVESRGVVVEKKFDAGEG